jgi:DNA polymerase III epsilon subunit-like protein
MNFIAIDTETGGTDPTQHGLLQVGLYDPTTRAELELLIRPAAGMGITDEAARINGYPETHAMGSLSELEAAKKFLDFLRCRRFEFLVAHNISFDLPFIKAWLRRAGTGKVWLGRPLCSMTTAALLAEVGGYDAPSFSLDSLIAELVPDFPRPKHGALVDAKASAAVMLEMLARFGSMADLANKAAQSNVPETQKEKIQRPLGRWGRSTR